MATCRLSDNEQPITIITANIGYRTGTTFVPGDHEKVKEAFSKLIKEKRPTLVFLQESKFKSIKFKKWRKYEIPSEYKNAPGDESPFLYDSNELDLSLVNSTIIKRIRKAITGGDESKLPLKWMPMVFVKPSTKSSINWESNILCVSWHGPNLKSDLENEKVLKWMLELVQKLSEEKDGLPFVIGGDFNLPITGVKEVLTSFNEMKAYEFQPTGRRRYRQIDFFISSNQLNLTDVEPVPWNCEEFERILDHDPIFAKLQVNSGKAFEKSTADEPNNTDWGIEDSIKKLDIEEKHKIKREDTEYVKEESEKEVKKLIKTLIAEEFIEEIEDKIDNKIEKYSRKISEETKTEIKEEIVEQFKEIMEEFN